MQSKRGYKILVIEDEDSLNKVICEKLGKQGYIAHGALNGESGLEALKSFKPQIVWLDLKLPDIDGMDILKKIRNNKDTKHLPVMIVSNVSNPETIYESTDLTRYYFTKIGWDLDELINNIAENIPNEVSEINNTEADKKDIRSSLNLD